MVICVGAMRKTLKRWRSTLMVAVTLLGFTMCLLTGTGIYVEPNLEDGDYEYVHEDIQPVPRNWRGLSESQVRPPGSKMRHEISQVSLYRITEY